MAAKQKQRRRSKRERSGRARAARRAQGIAPAPRDGRDIADSQRGLRHMLRGLAAERGEWAGIPMVLTGERLVIEPTYPYAALSKIKPRRDGEIDPDELPSDDPTGWKVRNSFWSTKLSSTLHIMERPDGRITCAITPGVHHFDHDLRTLGCSDAWGIEQETRAMELLRTLIKPRPFKQYILTGMFLETSKRSGVTYMFRRLKPTVAMTSRRPEGRMGILAALCLHPIGYYEGSWAGSMTPTDDVIAHLMLMRGDEHLFWRRAQQHPPWRPEAGL